MHSFRKYWDQNLIADWTMRIRDAPYVANRRSDLFQHGVDGGKGELLSTTVLAFYIP